MGHNRPTGIGIDAGTPSAEKSETPQMEGLSKQEQLAAQQHLNRWQLRINGPIVAATGVLLLWMRSEKLTGAITLLCGVTAFGLSFVLFRGPNNGDRSSSGPADHPSGPEVSD